MLDEAAKVLFERALMLKSSKDPRDGDGDGMIFDGTPHQRPVHGVEQVMVWFNGKKVNASDHTTEIHEYLTGELKDRQGLLDAVMALPSSDAAFNVALRNLRFDGSRPFSDAKHTGREQRIAELKDRVSELLKSELAIATGFDGTNNTKPQSGRTISGKP